MPSPFLSIHPNSLHHSKATQSTAAQGPSPYTSAKTEWSLRPGSISLILVPLVTADPAGQLLMCLSYLLIKLQAPFEHRNHVVLSRTCLASTMMPCYHPLEKGKTCISHRKIEKSRLSLLKKNRDSGHRVHTELPWATLLETPDPTQSEDKIPSAKFFLMVHMAKSLSFGKTPSL